MASITTQNIMDLVKNLLIQAGEEEWDTDFTIQAFEDKKEEIKSMIEAGLSKKTKKDSSPKDPNKPKRGKSAYIFFCSDAREGVKEELGDVKPQEVIRELGVQWRALKESQKKSDKTKVAKYNKMAEEDKERAAREMETYVPPTEEELLANKPKRGRKSTKKKSDKPKRGKSAYLFFCGEMRQELKEEFPDADGKEITRMLGERWSELKDDKDREDELSKYEELAKEDKERYDKEMESYVPSEEDEEEKPKTKKTERVKKTESEDSEIDKVGFKKFANASREDYKEENPEMKPAQITKLMKEEWATMEASEKKAWFEEEQEDDEE